MKTILIILIVALGVGIAVCSMKPSDAECYSLIKDELKSSFSDGTAYSLFKNYLIDRGVDFGKHFTRIEDHLFYKEVLWVPNDVPIATAYCNTISLTDNFSRFSDDLKTVSFNFKNRVERVKEKIANSNAVRKIRNAFSNNRHDDEAAKDIGNDNDLTTLNYQLAQAQAKLEKLRRFHLLRTSNKKQSQIEEQEELISGIEERIRSFQ